MSCALSASEGCRDVLLPVDHYLLAIDGLRRDDAATAIEAFYLRCDVREAMLASIRA